MKQGTAEHEWSAVVTAEQNVDPKASLEASFMRGQQVDGVLPSAPHTCACCHVYETANLNISSRPSCNWWTETFRSDIWSFSNTGGNEMAGDISEGTPRKIILNAVQVFDEDLNT